MARLTKTYTVDSNGKRDAGKAFLITEMSPIKSFKWGCKAVIALVNAGVKFPDGAEEMGMAGLMGLALSELTTGVDWELVEPLLDELMTCVKIMPNPEDPDITRGLYESDIEEFKTIAALHSEVFKLHLNFTETAAQ